MNRLPSIDDRSFPDAVDRAAGTTVVDFGAEWCGPCRIVTPILQQLAEEFGPRVRVLALDVDRNPATAARFGVRNLPTLLFFRDGAVVGRVIGAVPRAVLREKFESLTGGSSPAAGPARDGRPPAGSPCGAAPPFPS